jgi:hypothetical protein
MGYNQEAYDAECAALARALETAARRQTTPERVTIFTDAQAAIKRMASEELAPGQEYAVQASKNIAVLRRPGRASSSRSGGALLTRKSQEMRRPTSGPSSRRTSRTHMEWNGYGTPLGPERDRCHFPVPSRTSSGRSRRRSGLKPAAGQQAVSPPRNTSCRVSSGRTRQWPVSPRGSPLGSTSPRQGTASLAST